MSAGRTGLGVGLGVSKLHPVVHVRYTQPYTHGLERSYPSPMPEARSTASESGVARAIPRATS